jgi:hypothetical protein
VKAIACPDDGDQIEKAPQIRQGEADLAGRMAILPAGRKPRRQMD